MVDADISGCAGNYLQADSKFSTPKIWGFFSSALKIATAKDEGGERQLR